MTIEHSRHRFLVRGLVARVRRAKTGNLSDLVAAFEPRTYALTSPHAGSVIQVSFSPVHGGIYGGTADEAQYAVVRATNCRAEDEPFGAIPADEARKIYGELLAAGFVKKG